MLPLDESPDVAVEDARTRSVRRFGLSAVREVEEVYQSVWGRDASRRLGEPRRGKAVDPAEVFEALERIAERDAAGRAIAESLVQALRYARGVTDERNFPSPISASALRDIAARWRRNRESLEGVCADGARDLEVFAALRSEWATFLELLEDAKRMAGVEDVDAFEGISAAAVHAGLRIGAGRSRAEVERELARGARELYEKADLLAVGAICSLMRVQPEHVEERLGAARWDTLLHWAVLARLHGEGRLDQTLRLYIEASSPGGPAFWDLVRRYADALEVDYRVLRPVEQLDVDSLASATARFFESCGPVRISDDFDFDEAWARATEAERRRAEGHLAEVERLYSGARLGGASSPVDPADVYGAAVLSVLDAVESPGVDRVRLASQLATARAELLRARALADRRYGHDYLFSTGDGERVGEIVSRGGHPRQRLYHLEAFAERVAFAANAALEECPADGGARLLAAFERAVGGEAALYVEEWIASLAARRATIFGFEPPETIPDNGPTLRRDECVREARLRLVAAGADPLLWGPIATGYTTRLRYLVRDGDGPAGSDGDVVAALEERLARGEAAAVVTAVRGLSPYAADGEADAAVTVGVHVHNADLRDLHETLLHVRALAWPRRRLWTLLGTTSSRPDVAREERRLALALGLSRVAIANRQLLKAGNQNRVIPNAPQSPAGESFYFTLDDDNRPAPMALHRAVGELLRHRSTAYVQMPVHYRAANEPGHGAGRRADAAAMAAWSASWAPPLAASRDGVEPRARRVASVAFPLGSGTLIRTTPGACFLDATGGFVADPDRVLVTEDLATGLLASHMRAMPDEFAERIAPWSDGTCLSEVWVVADGVDFAPGLQQQKRRWAEGSTQCLRHYWMPFCARAVRRGLLPPASAARTTIFLAGWAIAAAGGTLSFVVFPLLALVPGAPSMSAPSLLVYALLLLALPLALDQYVNRAAGLSAEGFADRFAIGYHGSYLASLVGTVEGAFGAPSERWPAAKGARGSRPTHLAHLALALFNVIAGAVGVARGAPVFALCFAHGALFLSLLRFREPRAISHRDRLAALRRDASDRAWKRAVRRMGGASAMPGRVVPPGNARPVLLAWSATTVTVVLLMVAAAAGSGSRVLSAAVLLAGGAHPLFRALQRGVTFWLSTRAARGGGLREEARLRAAALSARIRAQPDSSRHSR